jgi:hypothetical protein
MSQSLTQTQSILRLDVTYSEAAGVQPTPKSSQGCDAPEFAKSLERLFNKFDSNADSFSIVETQGAVYASGTITIASTGPTNTETMTIAGVTITATSGSASNNHFVVSSTPSIAAANLAACINASTSLTGIVTATSALGVVTVTAAAPGLIGNGLVMANVNLANTTVVSFANGAGTIYTSACGF